MMHRLIAIMLIPLFAVANSLAHSHSTAAHQASSHGRAHFHVGIAPQHSNQDHEPHEHSHHGHGHDHERDDSESAPVNPADHDSDAVYLVAADVVYTTSDRSLIEFDSDAVVKTVKDYPPQIQTSNRWRDRRRYSTAPEIPLYLLHAALRL